MKLTVLLANTFRTEIAIVHENESFPYILRSVQIELTEEQVAAIAPRHVGDRGGKPVYEEVLKSWIEPAD